METYFNFIKEASNKKKHYDKHHVIPKSQWNSPKNNMTVELMSHDHMWAHILYDRANGTNTSKLFRNITGLQNVPLEDITYEQCFRIDELMDDYHDKVSESVRESWRDPKLNEIRRKRMSLAKQGKPNVCKGRIWINNGVVNKRIEPRMLKHYEEQGFRTGKILQTKD